MEKQQTAVEWLANELYEKMEMKGNGNVFDKILEKANKMFEKQIIDAWEKGDFCIDLPDGTWKQKYESGEQYYNEKFKSE